MSYRCPYTEVCRAQASREFVDHPDLITLFTQRLQCGERDEMKAQRCATLLGLAEQEFPTLGQYVQKQRRGIQLPQRELAEQAGMDLQALRDLELNKLDPQQLPVGLIERLAHVLAAPVEYIKVLARITSQAGLPRQGVVFARTIVLQKKNPEEEGLGEGEALP
ncbi:MAG: XRE family transcriptional regulator [Candidatus Viridilinea halotolerans]|uniref:XRE family transcriptional regulator n=1 Tax=Candidatus Viridilinea halotolerans TaxID=2491704 RepID=A0A426U073_9CHLR|nr:MAG: XRE family transcriptional regulator [Candidatus Viridilinea halotolerans]